LTSAAIPAVFVLLWSTGWISAKYAAINADPLWFLTIRFACAFAVIALFAAAVRAPWPRGRIAWGHALVSGILIHGLYLGGVWWAVKHGLPTGLSGLLGERVSPVQWLGVGLGFAGVLLVLSPKLGVNTSDAAWLALGVNVVGMLAVTAGSFYQKRFVSAADLRTVTAAQYIGALMVVAPLALATEEMRFDHTVEAYATLAWSVLVLSVVTVSLMLRMINRGEVTRVSALIYLVPSTVAVMAWILFGETLNLVQTCGMALTAAGVWLAMRKGR
jgi:drug/metabolite transporter (DMT)-like permease